MPNSRRPLLLARTVAVFLVGLAVWFLLRGGEEDPRRALPADPAGSPSVPREPALLPVARPPAAHAEPPEGAAETPTPPRDAPAAPLRRVALRVLDAAGRPIDRASIGLLVSGPDGVRTVRWNTGRDGRAEKVLPRGRIVSVWVDAPALTGARRVFNRVDPAGIDLETLGDVQADMLLMLTVRTVDRTGLPRPGWRILYRPREEDEQARGSWGVTTDDEALCHVGPFEPGTRVELRSGARGLTPAERTDPAGWHAVHVDGTDIELVVGDAYRLMLAFPDVSPNVSLRIAALDADTGELLFPPVQHTTGETPWTAPALTPGRRLEVLVTDPAGGRYARLFDVLPGPEPLAVALEVGVAITGRVTAPELEWGVEGSVQTKGRGFEVTALLDGGGRFKFRGLPDEPFTLTAVVRAEESGGRTLMGSAQRGRERDVRIALRKTLRITGHCVVEGTDSSQRWRPSWCVARSPRWPEDIPLRSPGSAELRFEVPAGRWHILARGTARDGTPLSGELDLGAVQFDREDVVVYVR